MKDEGKAGFGFARKAASDGRRGGGGLARRLNAGESREGEKILRRALARLEEKGGWSVLASMNVVPRTFPIQQRQRP